MLEHYTLRLENFVSLLKQSLDECCAWILSNADQVSMPISQPILNDIRELMALVAAWSIRRHPGSQEFLQNSANTYNPSGRLWLDICFVGRVREAYMTITKTVYTLPSFADVSIYLVPTPKRKKCKQAIGNPAPLSFHKTLETLGLSLNDATIKAVLGNSKDASSATGAFDELQKQDRELHAEMRMILHLNSIGETDICLNYIGCSRRSCFFCHCFLKASGKYTTRGCHGKLYPRWVMPQASALTEDGSKQVDETLRKMQDAVTTQILSPLKAQQHVAESSVGCCGSVNGSEVLGQSLADRYKVSRYKALDASFFAKCLESWARSPWPSPESNDKPSFAQLHGIDEQSSDISPQEVDQERQNIVGAYAIHPVLGECGTCERQTYRKCSDCNKDWFCSDHCQKKRSTRHLFKCAPGRPLNTADYLDLAVFEDRLPDDPQTREDYGFARTKSFHEESYLFGLYQGLMYKDITSKQIHQWRVEGSLVENIHKYYLEIPSTSRGGYYPWFVENQHLLDTTKISEVSAKTLPELWLDKARVYLDPADRLKQPRDLQPKAKRDSFILFMMALKEAHPGPELEIYYNFGFCTCEGEFDERREGRLGGLYQRLFFGEKRAIDNYLASSRIRSNSKTRPCTFSEFWRAYAQGKLPQLFDAKGLREERVQFKHLGTFLANNAPGSGHGQPSVWRLNQFLACKEDLQAPLPVLVDYGFMNCETVLQKMELKSFYEKVLCAGDALELHDARVRGKIYEYALRVLNTVDPQFRVLVRNLSTIGGGCVIGTGRSMLVHASCRDLRPQNHFLLLTLRCVLSEVPDNRVVWVSKPDGLLQSTRVIGRCRWKPLVLLWMAQGLTTFCIGRKLTCPTHPR